MISIKFEEREKIGLQYALETLHGCSPFGQERVRRLRFYAPEERAELEEELYNVEQAANAAGELKDDYNRLMTGLCQMKDIRNSLRRCAEGETPDHVELFEIKGYLQRLEGIRPLFERITAVTRFKGMAFHDVTAALAILDPDGTGSRGFYIPDSATPKLKEIRNAKKTVEERLFHAQTDAEKDDLQFAMTAYGLCVLLETHGEIEKADALREKLLARDGFWFCFSYLAAYSDYNYTVKPATVK